MSFSSVAKISAQTEEASNQAAQIAVAEEASMQTAARPEEPAYEFVISREEDFALFMITPVFWKNNHKVTLECNIDMREKVFNPIKEFSGVFDGCEHTISNLKIQNKSAKGKNTDLSFINTLNENAEIKNVTFDNYTIEGKSGIKKAAGLIVTNHGTISGVDVINGSINNIGKKANAVGFVLDNEENGIIENCFVGMNNKDSNIQSGFVGINHGKITGCSTTLSVNSKDIAGGFCGKNSGDISYCKSEGNVKAKTNSDKAATICGGFVGDNNGKIKNSSSIGAVEGQEFTGGFAGKNGDDGEISSSKATCYVKSHTYLFTISCGGFVGVSSGKIEDCSFEGKIDGCVDGEKTLGCSVTVVVVVTALILIIALLSLHSKKNDMVNAGNDLKNAQDNLENARKDMVEDIVNAYDYATSDVAKSNPFKALKNKIIGYFSGYNKNGKNRNFIENAFKVGEAECEYERKVISYKLEKVDVVLTMIGIFFDLSTTTLLGVAIGLQSANIGGFCGINAGEINGCSANIESLNAKSLYNKHNMCGGFVGINGETGTIKDSVATGNEIINKTYTGGHLGGFVGDNSGKIENGTTTVSVANGKFTGGFCGSNSGEISGSKSEGNAVANAKAVETKCGGFVGNNDKQGKISSCISKGSAEGQEYVGGFCGDNTGEISKSKSEGNATAKTVSNTNRCGGFTGENSGNINDCNSIGSATGEEYVGGFAGVNKNEIIDCNANGKATAKTKTHTALAGGFVGENEKGTIISCTATGGADSRSSSGQAKAGGFVGINKASIMSSKASGSVYLSAGTCYKDDGCGGFVGKNDQGGSIDECYAESIVETTNKKKGGGFVGEAKNKSTIKNSQCKTKIVTKSGTKNNTKFCENKDKKAVIEN